eukprot:TRINITY_DN1802_c0_g1_i1.p1 TRINITY_DN1802_c0_g1~~TRINITY_DN1802_c0_g1_i1.p1  ORF type:complete len:199 (-),score=39.70 TRINITY_DN1802_c0_g1_i1:60-656(-)
MSKKILLKLIVLGESGVGKTSLLVRYVNNKFTMATKSTIGADFLTKHVVVDEKPATLQIWDTAGQERFQGLGTSFYRGSDGAVFVFDVTRKQTFDELGNWKKSFLIQIQQENNSDFPMLVIANKIDKEEERQVSKKTLEQWCNENNLPFIEASAKEALNVEKAFLAIAKQSIAKLKPGNINYDVVDLSQETEEKKGCC